LKITIAANFNGVLHVRPQNSICYISGHRNSSGLNTMTTKSGKQSSSDQKRIRVVYIYTFVYYILLVFYLYSSCNSVRMSHWNKRLLTYLLTYLTWAAADSY